MLDVVELARSLIRVDTAGRNEDAAISLLIVPLRAVGFEIVEIPWRDGRSNILARWRGGGQIALCAHLDTVPYEASEWTRHPLDASVESDRLFGRGSSDMKGGAAAMVCAAVSAATGPNADELAFSVVLTSAEESGCEGAKAVASTGLLPMDPVLIIGEATGNRVRFGHKGATWLRVTARGRSAHGSRPDLGVNAIEILSDAIHRLRHLTSLHSHPSLGARTTSIGTISGGQQANIVPHRAEMTIDTRTVPGSDVNEVHAALMEVGALDVERLLDLPAIWTDPKSAISERVVNAVAGVVGFRSAPTGVAYFTDGAVLGGTDPHVFIIGPGDPDAPHTADESCSIERIREAERIYYEFVTTALTS